MPAGGARAGSGPKPRASRADFDHEHAQHERVKREQREFKLAVERGLYLPRAAVQSAAATALAVLSQSMRSLPDTMERRHSLAPELAEAIAVDIDTALTECAAAFRAMADG